MTECVSMSYGLYQFDPVPLMAISKDYTRRGNEGKLLADLTIDFSGTLLPNLGVNAPTPSGTDTRIAKLRIMQDQLKDALSTDRDNLLIVDASGFIILNVFPRIESLSFEEDILVMKSNYTVSFIAQEEEQNEFIESATDSWDSVRNPDETYTVSHTVSAKGIRGDYDAKGADIAFVNAKDFVLTKISQNPSLQQFFLTSASGLTSYNHTKSETKDTEEATYSITESWTLHSSSFTDDRTENTTFTYEPNGDQNVTLTINGTVQGLATGDEPTPPAILAAAQAGFDGTVIAEIGFNNTTGISARSKETNEFSGTLNYSLTRSSNPSGFLIGKTEDRTFSRDDDGSTTQTVTVSAQLLPQGSGTINDVIAYVDANIDDINSTNPPYSTASGVLISRASTRNELSKSFSRTNIYIDAASTIFREEYTINADLNDTGLLEVSVNGSVIGLDDESTTSSEERFAKAETGFTTVQALLAARAQDLADDFSRTLNTAEITKGISHNRKTGVIGYTFSYNDRAIPPTGIIKETLTVNDTGGDPVVVTIPVPGRAAGPVFQKMNTITSYKRTVNLDWTLAEGTTESAADLLAQTAIEAFVPTVITNNIFVTQSKSFDAANKRLTWNVTWEYQVSGSDFRLTLTGDS